MSDWKLAPALAALISDVNATWPNRDKSWDGTIGDAAHAARDSQHNPNREPGDDVPDGYVTAADITTDGPLDEDRLIDVLKHDRRVWYVIHAGRIWSRTYGFANRPYTGADPHLHHIHISLVQTARACNDTRDWLSPAKPESPYQRIARIAAQRLRRIRSLKRRLRTK